jgi:hypothetical protein
VEEFMKQLYYTSCEAGKSVSGQSGFQVRAASTGAAPERLRAAIRYAGYRLPAGMPAETDPAAAPVRLALLNTADMGRLLCHSSYTGQDPSTGRFGNFFSHLLLDVPAEVDAAQAIHSWGSRFWRRAHEGGTELPEATPRDLATGGSLDDGAFAPFLRRPRRREMLRFVLQAFLLSRPDQRIFLAAPPEDVALCVGALARSLPRSLLAGLTFSTYESEPLGCAARVIGTCWDRGAAQDLPSACYSGSCLAFNVTSGRCTPLPGEAPFAAAALAALDSGRFADLDRFFATWERLGVQDPALLDLVYRIDQGSAPLSKEDSQATCRHPGLASLLLARPAVAAQVVSWALEDPAYRAAVFPPLLQSLRLQPAVLGQLADHLRAAGVAALRASDLDRARLALEDLLRGAEPGRFRTLWGDLFIALDDPGQLSEEARFFLLPRVLPRDPDEAVPQDAERVRRWLEVPPAQLERLLGLDIPLPHKAAACLTCLAREEPPGPALRRALANHPELLLEVLPDIDPDQRALDLFDAVLKEMRQVRLAKALAGRATLRPPVLDHCLDAALRRNPGEAEDVIREHGKRLVRVLPEGRSVVRMAEVVLLNPAADAGAHPRLVEFFDKLLACPAAGHLSKQAAERLDDLLVVDRFLKQPSLREEALRNVAAVLGRLPRGSPASAPQCLRVLTAAAEALFQHDKEDVKPALEAVLAVLGPAAGRSPAELYRELVRSFQRRAGNQFWKKTDLLHALVAVGFGELKRKGLAEQLDEVYPEAGRLTRQIRASCPRKVVTALDQRSMFWGREPRKNWRLVMNDAASQESAAEDNRPVSGKPLRMFFLLIVGVLAGMLLLAVLLALLGVIRL